MNRQTVESRTILLGRVGSHAYRLATPASDLDYKGVCIGLKEHYLGFEKFEQKENGWDEEGIFPCLDGIKDAVIFELRKFLHLIADNNPNILELLWLDAEDYTVVTPIGKILLAKRQEFLSTKVKHTFSGYAMAQLKRIEVHRKWLLHPVEIRPLPAQFGFTHIPPIAKDEVNAFLEFIYTIIRDRIAFLEVEDEFTAFLEDRLDFKGALKQYALPIDTLGYVQYLTKGSDNFIQQLHATQSYQSALRAYENYQQWKANRNPTRAALEAKVGYDAKHAMHCLRLLRMGIEILKEGEVRVNRERAGDAQLLRAVRNCEYSYEQIMEMAQALLAEMDTVYSSSTLPKVVNRKAVGDLCMELVERMGWD